MDKLFPKQINLTTHHSEQKIHDFSPLFHIKKEILSRKVGSNYYVIFVTAL